MDDLFRLNGTLPHDPAIDTWFDAQPPALGAIAREWFEYMRACGPDVRETIHDGQPTACVDDAAFAYVDAFKAHVNVGFFHSAELEDPAGLLEGTGRRMRHVKLHPDIEVDRDALQALIDAAYEDVRSRLEA